MTRSGESDNNGEGGHDAEQAALARDAERYRWLRRFAVPAFNARSRRCVILLPKALGKQTCLSAEGLDALVDVFAATVPSGR